MWEPAEFKVATSIGPSARSGYVYCGLGLHQIIRASPKGRRPPQWKLTHLGTGHAVAIIKGRMADAFPIASELAEASDWDFDSLTGWLNQDPELPDKTLRWISKFSTRVRRAGGGRLSNSEQVARQIAIARAA